MEIYESLPEDDVETTKCDFDDIKKEQNFLKVNKSTGKGPKAGENTLDYIFARCDLIGIGSVATSQLINFLGQLIDGTELDKDLLEELRSMLDPCCEDAEVDRNRFRKAMEEWEEVLNLQRAAENIEIIETSTGFTGNNSCNGDVEKNWKTPEIESDDTKDQLMSSNNDLMLQKKWLEDQNADLILLLKNSEESNTSLQSNCDSLLKKNEDLQATAEQIKILRADNDELKELLIKSEEKCSDLSIKMNKLELEAINHQNILSDIEAEKSALKVDLESYINKEKEYLKALDFQSEQILHLSEEVKVKEEKWKSEAEKVEELQANIEGLLTALKNHEEEKQELEETLVKMQEQYLNMTPTRNLQSSWKLSPKYVAGLCSYEEVRDECKTLYKDLFSESPVDVSENQDMSIETELKGQVEKQEEEFEIDMPEAKLLYDSFKDYMESLKTLNGSADAQQQRSECLSEMTVKETEEAEVDVDSRVRAGDDAWMQFHADEGSEAPSCACSHEAGHPSPERLRRLQVVREVAALRSQILRSQAVLAALAQSSDLLGVPEAASAARGVSDYADVYDVRSVGSNATQHGHQPRSMESVAPSLPCVGGRASSGVLGTTGEAVEEGEEGAGVECREGRRQLTKSCPALASQVSIATQVDVEDLLTPPPSRAGEEAAAGAATATVTRGGAPSPKRARSSSFLAAIEGAGTGVGGESEEEQGQEQQTEARSSSPSPRIDEARAGAALGPQTIKEDSQQEEVESIGEASEPPDLSHATTVFEPRVEPLDLDEYRSVRKLSVLPEENEESLAGAGGSEGGITSSSPSTSSPHRSSLRRSRASPTPPPYRPPPNPYRPHSRSFESYLDPEHCIRRREEGGSRQGVPRQCSDPTPAASTLRPATPRDSAPEDSPRSPLRHSSTSRPLELFGGGPKAVRFDGTLEPTASGDFRRKPTAFTHRRLCPPPPSTSPLAEEEETVRTPNSPGGSEKRQFPRMEQDQEGREAVLEATEEEEEAAREAGGGRRIRARRRSTPGSPAAAIKRSAAVDYGEGVEEGGASSGAAEAETAPTVAVPFPSLTDPTLCKMGLLGGSSLEGAAKPCDLLSEQDIESKFTSLSLAFKTDKITLGSRLELQQRQRDLAEKNVLIEIMQLKSTLNCLNHLCTDMETTELLGKIRHQVDVLQHSTQRVSSHAEMYGAVQQESRVSTAIEVMLLHVENLKRLHEKDHGELEDTKRILLENNIVLECGVDAVEEGRPNQRTARYRSLQTLVGANKMGSRRRASIAAIPRIPGRMEAFISSSPMDVGVVGRVSAAGPLITSTATTTTTNVDAENERRRESFASQLFGYGNCTPTESPEKSGWSITPPGEEEDDTQVVDDASEGGTSSWEGLVASAAEVEDGAPLNSQPTSSEDSSRGPRRSLGSGEVTILRRDGLVARGGVEGRASDDRWPVSSSVPAARSPPPLKIPSLSGVLRDWFSKWTKTSWLGQRRGSAIVQEKGLTLLHARHCLTCILLVVAVISLGATIVSTDAHADRWHHMADYRYEFGKVLRPYITLRHYGPPPM